MSKPDSLRNSLSEPTTADPVFLTTFLDSHYLPAKILLRPSTIRQIRLTLSLWTQQLGRSPTTDDFATAKVRAYLTWQSAKSKPATTNSKRGILLALWQVAHDEGLAGEPEPRKIRRLPSDPIPAQAWAIEQVRDILAAVEKTYWPSIDGIPARKWFRAFLLTLYSTGERRSAVLAVAPGAVRDGTIIFRRTKTKARLCPLLPEAAEAIDAMKGDREKLFPWPHSEEQLSNRLRQLFRLAGVPYGRQFGGLAHKFRRTACTLCEANGGDGARLIGDTRHVAEKSYIDKSVMTADLSRLPSTIVQPPQNATPPENAGLKTPQKHGQNR